MKQPIPSLEAKNYMPEAGVAKKLGSTETWQVVNGLAKLSLIENTVDALHIIPSDADQTAWELGSDVKGVRYSVTTRKNMFADIELAGALSFRYAKCLEELQGNFDDTLLRYDPAVPNTLRDEHLQPNELATRVTKAARQQMAVHLGFMSIDGTLLPGAMDAAFFRRADIHEARDRWVYSFEEVLRAGVREVIDYPEKVQGSWEISQLSDGPYSSSRSNLACDAVFHLIQDCRFVDGLTQRFARRDELIEANMGLNSN